MGGIVFADVSHISQKTPGAVAATATAAASNGYPAVNGNSIDIKRGYLIFDHAFDTTYSANITTDLIYDGTARSTQLFLKKAYLQAKYADALVIRAGDTELPWVPFAEGVEGYRFVENTLIDRIKYGTTNGAAAPATLTPYLASVGATKLSYLVTPNTAPAGSGIIGGLAGQTGTYDELGIFTQYRF